MIVHPRREPLVHLLYILLDLWDIIMDMLSLDDDQKAANGWNQVNDTHLEGLCLASPHGSK